MDTQHITNYHDDCQHAAEKIIAHVGKTIVIAIPIGIGKPISLINALYTLAKNDSSIQLTIITGLTLARPSYRTLLEKNFIAPILDRLLEDYQDPLYERDRELNCVPTNVKIIEFFLLPGKFLHNSYVQQHYISSAYTAVVGDLAYYRVNVIAQQVAPSKLNNQTYSLSSNSDLFHDALVHLDKSKTHPYAIIAEVNKHLPYMHGDAIIPANTFTDIIDSKVYHHLFAMPREDLSPQDHLIGLYTSCLIKDGGCLQLGIGKLSSAIANALIMRHKYNTDYQALLHDLDVFKKFGDVISHIGDVNPFTQGLYSSTEMISDAYMHLCQAGILKKRVYDHTGLQRLLNRKLIDEKVTEETLIILLEHNIINPQLTHQDINFLKKYGILRGDTEFKDGYLYAKDQAIIQADLSSSDNLKKMSQHCLGTYLLGGKVIDAAFFVGSKEFYKYLHNLPDETLSQINMTSVARTNSISRAPMLFALQRTDARLINSALMVTLNGSIVSDGLINQQELSGVGGQFNFAYMAHYLNDARFIINCRSTRQSKNKTLSNIVFEYPNITLPRYLRDIVITEYGIADLKSKTDTEIIKAILNITDARFQVNLLQMAKQAKKIPNNYHIQPIFSLNNNPNYLNQLIDTYQSKGFCQTYPFGSDLTHEEQILQNVLLHLKSMSKVKVLFKSAVAFFYLTRDERFIPYLKRMDLLKPKSLKTLLYKQLIKLTLVKYL